MRKFESAAFLKDGGELLRTGKANAWENISLRRLQIFFVLAGRNSYYFLKHFAEMYVIVVADKLCRILDGAFCQG